VLVNDSFRTVILPQQSTDAVELVELLDFHLVQFPASVPALAWPVSESVLALEEAV
jgi:hypothetical protein